MYLLTHCIRSFLVFFSLLTSCIGYCFYPYKGGSQILKTSCSAIHPCKLNAARLSMNMRQIESIKDHEGKSILKIGLISSTMIASIAVSNRIPAAAEDMPTDNFLVTESGLKYRDIVIGTGAAPLPGDSVSVHYTGWLDDFDSPLKFDSSYDRRAPLNFKVGLHQVIAGWDEGILTNLRVGGKRELIIPSSLAYGKRGAGGVIPPDATLYFRIELVAIR